MLISEEKKLDAWQWLCREALAGNANAVTVLVDWSTGDLPPDEPDLDQIAVTFQWWLDHEEQHGAAALGNGVKPPKYPTVELVSRWISELRDASAQSENVTHSSQLDDIRLELMKWIDYVSRCFSKSVQPFGPDTSVMYPTWPTRATLTTWIRVLLHGDKHGQ